MNAYSRSLEQYMFVQNKKINHMLIMIRCNLSEFQFLGNFYNHWKIIVIRAIYILNSEIVKQLKMIDWHAYWPLDGTGAAADLSFYDPAQLIWKQYFWSKVDPIKIYRKYFLEVWDHRIHEETIEILWNFMYKLLENIWKKYSRKEIIKCVETIWGNAEC